MKNSVLHVALALAILGLAVPSLAKGTSARYQITITNLTSNQIFAPPLVASHSSQTSVFEAGQPASPELALLAEDGDTSQLAAALAADPEVFHVAVADGAIMPGGSRSIELELRGRYNRLSLAGMLVTTNDAFVGLDSLKVVRSQRVMAPAYDAGSEVNSESCAFIPGPPCGNGGVRDTAGAEGYVYVHSGIHGIAELPSHTFDWHNPVASISIHRMY